MLEQKKKKENLFILILQRVFVYNIKYKIFAFLCGFAFWLLLSICL